MDVFPNPTFGEITINSSIFKSGNTQILVFDISGKLLLQKNEQRRLELIDFDLGDLPNGVYMIQLMNQNYFVQERVVVAN